jgi:hypothetical protein
MAMISFQENLFADVTSYCYTARQTAGAPACGLGEQPANLNATPYITAPLSQLES